MVRRYSSRVLVLIALCGAYLGSSGAASKVPPVVRWNPDPANNVIRAGSAVQLYWFWQDASESPVKTRIIVDNAKPPCPSQVFPPQGVSLPSNGNRPWYPTVAGSYSCTVEFELKDGSKVQQSAVLTVVN